MDTFESAARSLAADLTALLRNPAGGLDDYESEFATTLVRYGLPTGPNPFDDVRNVGGGWYVSLQPEAREWKAEWTPTGLITRGSRTFDLNSPNVKSVALRIVGAGRSSGEATANAIAKELAGATTDPDTFALVEAFEGEEALGELLEKRTGHLVSVFEKFGIERTTIEEAYKRAHTSAGNRVIVETGDGWGVEHVASDGYRPAQWKAVQLGGGTEVAGG
jgi:hypothetical protein